MHTGLYHKIKFKITLYPVFKVSKITLEQRPFNYNWSIEPNNSVAYVVELSLSGSYPLNLARDVRKWSHTHYTVFFEEAIKFC